MRGSSSVAATSLELRLLRSRSAVRRLQLVRPSSRTTGLDLKTVIGAERNHSFELPAPTYARFALDSRAPLAHLESRDGSPPATANHQTNRSNQDDLPIGYVLNV